jgi:hypothetical protein
MKAFFNKGTFHGSSNYGFWQDDNLDAIRMRGYERKLHYGYGFNDQEELVPIPMYDENMSPAKWIHHEINKNPESVRFPTPFIKNEILKTAAFVNLYPKRAKSPIKPGDNLKKMGVPKWHSLNQFTFQTEEQMKNWQKFTDSLLRHYNISLEQYYLNEDSTLNYQKMILDIHSLIKSGLGCRSKEEIRYHLDPHRNKHRIFEKHPLLVVLKKSQHAMKCRLSDFYATTTACYASTIAAMSQDILDDEDGVDEFSLK